MIINHQFIGIPDWDVFKALYDLVESDLPVGPKLSTLNNLMMFFLRVRLSYGIEDLAFRFGVSKGQVSKHFHNVLDIIYVKTKPLIKWPDRDVLRAQSQCQSLDLKYCTLIDLSVCYLFLIISFTYDYPSHFNRSSSKMLSRLQKSTSTTFAINLQLC